MHPGKASRFGPPRVRTGIFALLEDREDGLSMNREHEDRTGIEPGERIAGRYEIIKRLGKGGMGQVYLASDLRLGRKLRAVKLLRPAEGMAAQTEAELRMLLAVNHPRLPQIVDYVPPDGARPAALITDYAEGENLAVWFERRGRQVDPLQTVEIGRQLCEALAYLHELTPPIVHRDIKPANVMIDGVGFIRLIDLGIARLVKQGSGQDTQHLGTPGYAAPEQGDPIGRSDERTDLYGLGALLFYLLSGGSTPAGGAADWQAVGIGLPTGLQAILAALLQRDPGRRPTSAQEVGRMLAGVQAGAGVGAGAGAGARTGTDAGAGADADVGAGAGAASGAGVWKGIGHADGRAEAGDEAGTMRVIAVASYAPGAGATFAAVTLSRLLAARDVPCVLVEHPLLEPQLFAMLSNGREASIYTGAHNAVRPLDKRYIGLRFASVIVHALHPDQPPPAAVDQVGRSELQCLRLQDLRALNIPIAAESRTPVCIVDLSGAWLDDAAYELAANCDEWLVVADPSVARWTPRRASAWRQVAEERERSGRGSLWLANQDLRFAGRREWLQHMPRKPIASIPLLPASEWRAMQYANRWATDRPDWRQALEEALLPVMSRF
jgi:eukaryotic-like serine/threonine-protein kinase